MAASPSSLMTPAPSSTEHNDLAQTDKAQEQDLPSNSGEQGNDLGSCDKREEEDHKELMAFIMPCAETDGRRLCLGEWLKIQYAKLEGKSVDEQGHILSQMMTTALSLSTATDDIAWSVRASLEIATQTLRRIPLEILESRRSVVDTLRKRSDEVFEASERRRKMLEQDSTEDEQPGYHGTGNVEKQDSELDQQMDGVGPRVQIQ